MQRAHHTRFGRKSILLALVAGLLFADPSRSAASTAEFAVGPDNNQELLFKTFNSARRKLQVNAYDFGHLGIARELIAAIRDGVTVELLVETQPFKGSSRALSSGAKKVLVEIFDAMKASGNTSHRIYLMGSNLYWENGRPVKVKRRFVFNHAKYVIVDGHSVLISSENFTETGHPDPGKKGNRGWDVLLNDVATVRKFQSIFDEDIQTSAQDVLEVKISGRLPSFISRPSEVQEFTGHDSAIAPKQTDRRVALPTTGGEVGQVSVITSPKAMPGLDSFMDSARRTLDLQFMSLPSNWHAGPNPYTSPFIENLLRLAQSGVKVRALLNDDRVFQDPGSDEDTKNALTVDYLNQIAKCHRLPIAAKVVDIEAVEITYIHNKGMIVDGKRVLVSSINGSRNSVQSNRETAVALDSAEAGQYFGRVFSDDWRKSGSAPLTSRILDCPELPQRRRATALFTPWARAF